jgi:hypothetical protein
VVDAFGNLAPGIHDATLAEIERQFGRFQRSDRRTRLFARLTEYVNEVNRGLPGAIIIVDGSFVMAKMDEPDDIDVLLVLPPGWDMAAELRPIEYSCIAKRMVRRRFGIDLFAVRPGSPELDRMSEFFSNVNTKWCHSLGLPVGAKKGLVRIVA